MATDIIRGMDHADITVSYIDETTRFFCEVFGAEIVYDSVSPKDGDIKGKYAESILDFIQE